MLTFEKFFGPSNLKTISRGFEPFLFQLIQPSAENKNEKKLNYVIGTIPISRFFNLF